MADAEQTIRQFLASHRDDETAFLAELVKVPSDNPPGDCDAHAARAAELLEGLGFTVERHPVPAELVRRSGHDRPAPTSSSASGSATARSWR